MQCHSQEDFVFKCDRISIGSGCTIGTGVLMLYSTTMGDGSALAPDSFLMKGEEIPANAHWGGNPAHEMPTRWSRSGRPRTTPSLVADVEPKCQSRERTWWLLRGGAHFEMNRQQVARRALGRRP